MGTRGAVGFHVDGKTFVTYNHFDSYPAGLGDHVVADLRELIGDLDIDGLREKVRYIEAVDTDDQDRPLVKDWNQRKRLARRLGVHTSETKTINLYESVDTMGIKDIVNKGYMIDSTSFLADSLFCEWAYIVNLDAETLEYYRGFQTEPHTAGRYHDMQREPIVAGNNTYYPVKLIASFDFRHIPDGVNALIENIVYEIEEDQFHEDRADNLNDL